MKPKKIVIGAVLAMVTGGYAAAKDIVHDAEFYVSQAQNGEIWAKEDAALDERLAAFPRAEQWQPAQYYLHPDR